MQIVIIPAHSTYKSIQFNQEVTVGGISLLERAVRNAKSAGAGLIVVVTDDQKVKRYGHELGCEIYFDKSVAKLSYYDLAKKVMIKFGKGKIDKSNIVFYNLNYPLIKIKTIKELFFLSEKNDGVFLRLKQKGLSPEGIKKLISSKQSKQDWISDAIFALKVDNKTPKKIKFLGSENIDLFSVHDNKSARIADLVLREINEEISFKIDSNSLPKIIFTDFDGCLTDDKVKLNSNNLETVKVNRKDGLAVGRLNDLNIKVIIISKEKNKIVSLRGKKLGIPVIQGIDNKVQEIENYLKSTKLQWKDVWYLGNDVNDLGPLGLAGLSFCPSDATVEARLVAQVVLSRRGGEGLLAEIATHLERKMSKSIVKQKLKNRT